LRVRRLSLTNFRNFDKQTFEFPETGVTVCGDNGRGKSNLLEAIYFLAVAKSGRGANDRDVVRWTTDHYVVEADIEREDGPLSARIAYDHRAQKKRAFLNDEPLARLSQLIGAFNAVFFSPEDVDLVLRNPAERRRLLDVLVAQSDASYLFDLEQYRRALAQRNRLLKESGRRLLDNAAPLRPWDLQLAEHGSRIIGARVSALDRLADRLSDFYARIAPAEESLSTHYRGVGCSQDVLAVRDALLDAYGARRADEVEVGYTLSGPHRDQFSFTLSERPAHAFGSKGQMKSVLLAWKLSEAVHLEERTGRKPVLLMDDVFSELDRSRALSALELMAEFGQLVLTSARDPDLDLRERGYAAIEL